MFYDMTFPIFAVSCFFGIILLVEFLPVAFVIKVKSDRNSLNFVFSFAHGSSQSELDEKDFSKRSRVAREAEVPCRKRTKRELFSLLNDAQEYNPYFSSIIKPVGFYLSRSSAPSNDFQYDDASNMNAHNFSRESFVEEVTRIYNDEFARRAGDKVDRIGDGLPQELPWLCPWTLKWNDLGPNIFPRYLRSVSCTRKSCWFGHMVCRPRAFAMIVLRKKNSKCFFPKTKEDDIMVNIAKELEEKWEIEEIAQDFCCECDRS